MAEEQGLVGRTVSSVASGVVEGVKGVVIGGVTGAVAGVALQELGVALQETAPETTAEVAQPALGQIRDFLGGGMAATGATVGGVIGGAYEGLKGLLGTRDPAEKILARENREQDAKLDQLAAGMNMSLGALAGTQQELVKTQQQVGVIGKFTEKLLAERTGADKAVPSHAAPAVQSGHFADKETARRDHGAAASSLSA